MNGDEEEYFVFLGEAKIYQSGQSDVITISAAMKNAANLKTGDRLKIFYDVKKKKLFLEKKK